MSGMTHACNPHGRSHTYCGRLITSHRGWFIAEDCEESARVMCAKCHAILRMQGEE